MDSMHQAGVVPPVNRRVSLRTVMEVVLHQGPISRADISKVTGLSKQTSSEVVRDLEEGGWIRSVGSQKGAMGRSAVLYELTRDRGMVVGVDLGGTKVHVAVANLSGDVVAEELTETDYRGGTFALEQVVALLESLMRRAPSGAPLLAVAIGCPGKLNVVTGAIHFAPNTPGLDQIDVPQFLREALGTTPFTIENAVNLGVVGEQWHGPAAGCENLVYAALGTGFGLGIILNGKLARGAHGAAGEIGFLPIGANPFRPESLTQGALETEIGAAGILRRHAGVGGKEQSVRAIFDAAKQGQPLALATIEDTGRLLALGLAAVVAILDPALIVLGGSIGVRPELLGPVRRHLEKCLLLSTPIEPSRLGSRATLVGAIASALHRTYNELFGAVDLCAELSLPPPSTLSQL